MNGRKACNMATVAARSAGATRVSRANSARAFAVLGMVLAMDPGCGPANSAKEAPDGPSLVAEATEGPVRWMLRVTPGEPTLEGGAEVVLEMTADAGTVLEMDSYAARLMDDGRKFQLRITGSSRESAVPLADGRLRWTQRYRLEFVLPGDYELPPAKASYLAPANNEPAVNDQPPSSASERREISTPALKVRVIDPGGASPAPEELAKIRMLDPVELRRPRDWTWWVGPAFGVALLVAMVLLTRSRRRPLTASEAVVPAHEWARARLVELLADDLLSRGRAHDFFSRLSDIVRGYIERRFSVSAPEMTTEEFLASVATDRRFTAAQTRALASFLEACDLVKYARHEPGKEEANDSFKAAQDYVEETRERPEESNGAGGPSNGRAEGREARA